ncbi:MAG: DUF6445 family protein, partial [Erythrobacter sp.]
MMPHCSKGSTGKVMTGLPASLSNCAIGSFSAEKHTIVTVDRFLDDPERAIERASLQNFAKITPQYPGLRAPLDSEFCDALTELLSPMLSECFAAPGGRWSLQA